MKIVVEVSTDLCGMDHTHHVEVHDSLSDERIDEICYELAYENALQYCDVVDPEDPGIEDPDVMTITDDQIHYTWCVYDPDYHGEWISP